MSINLEQKTKTSDPYPDCSIAGIKPVIQPTDLLTNTDGVLKHCCICDKPATNIAIYQLEGASVRALLQFMYSEAICQELDD